MTAKHPSWGEQPFDVADAGEQKSKVKKSKLKSKLKLKLKKKMQMSVALNRLCPQVSSDQSAR